MRVLYLKEQVYTHSCSEVLFFNPDRPANNVVGSKHIDSTGCENVKGNMFQKPAMENNYCALFPLVAVVDCVLKFVPVGNNWIVLGIECEE